MRGRPRAPGVMRTVGNETRPRRLWLRLSVEEDEALKTAAKAYGVNKTDLIRLFTHYVQTPSAHLLSGAPVVFDYATSHQISYDLNAIGILYNQSLRALNTVAKAMREGEDDPSEAVRVLAAVNDDMGYVRDSIACLREDVSNLSDRPEFFIW